MRPARTRTEEQEARKAPVAFARPDVLVESWYVVARSGTIHRGKVISTDEFGRRIAIYRDMQGDLHGVDGSCAHLGADLGQGRVVGDQLECAFHGWRYDAGGNCCRTPNGTARRRLRSYVVLERWGLVWLYAGNQPAFDLPDLPDNGRYLVLATPSQHIPCHPHLVISNGLDALHLEPLHGLELTAAPQLTRPNDHQVALLVHARPRSRWLQVLTKSRRRELVWTFTTVGASLAWATITEPLYYHVLFSARPSPAGGCLTQTVLFLPPSAVKALQALFMAALVTWGDRRILSRIQFMPAFTDGDEGLRAFAETVNRMRIFS